MDWTKSMAQTFEYYIVDPDTWTDKEQIDEVLSSTIERDLDSGTLSTASLDTHEELDECYVRIYLVATQNGEKLKLPLGTFIVQTPTIEYDGRAQKISMDAYSPLLELKDQSPPIGYSLLKGQNIMNAAFSICSENMRAPVVAAKCDETLFKDFVSNLDDTWLVFVSDLVSNAKYTLDLDEMGRVLFAPYQETAALQPVWTYTDDNSSILYPEVTVERDLYGVPNVVEVVYSLEESSGITTPYLARIVNDDPASPISTVSRGREVLHREQNPDFNSPMRPEDVDKYARNLLMQLSTLEYTVSYTHGYCPARVGDCVYLNYQRAGLTNIKAKVISQSIECSTGCKVTERAMYTMQLWGG